MKKMLLLGAMSAALLVPAGAAIAGDVPDGRECGTRADGATLEVPMVDNADDRGYACVRAGGTTVFYIGGEASAEGSGGRPCGNVVVGGTNVTGDNNWDKSDDATEEPGVVDGLGLIPPGGNTSGHCD